MTKIESAEWFKSGFPIDDERVRSISQDTDIQHVVNYRNKINSTKPIKKAVIKAAAKSLPKINLILYDSSDFYSGHICVLPLKNSSYLKIRNKEIDETSLYLSDLTGSFIESPQVFYFYSVDADSFENTYYMIKHFLEFFKKLQLKNYIFAGITYRENQVELLNEMGLETIWEVVSGENDKHTATFLEGNFDKFLFGE